MKHCNKHNRDYTEGLPCLACVAGLPERPLTPQEKATRAIDNGHVPTFLKALCELLMCSAPWPCSKESETELKAKADVMARNLGFTDWVEAYHGLLWNQGATP
jgi:hypothetical protein